MIVPRREHPHPVRAERRELFNGPRREVAQVHACFRRARGGSEGRGGEEAGPEQGSRAERERGQREREGATKGVKNHYLHSIDT